MKNLCRQNLQLQIESLIPIMELWISFLEETRKTQSELKKLPDTLEYLKQQAITLDLKESRWSISNQSKNSESEISQEVELHLQTLIGDLDAALPKLIIMESKISDLVALKERLEALKEKELEPIPNDLDKLVRKNNSAGSAINKGGYQYRLKLLANQFRHNKDWHNKDWRMGIAIAVGVIGFGAAFLAFNNYKLEASPTKEGGRNEIQLQGLSSNKTQVKHKEL